MTKEILIVGGVHSLPNGGILLGVNTMNEILRFEWRECSFSDLAGQFAGKSISIFGKEYEIHTKIVDVQISASIADFKNVFLKIEDIAMTSKIRELDEIEIEL